MTNLPNNYLIFIGKKINNSIISSSSTIQVFNKKKIYTNFKEIY